MPLTTTRKQELINEHQTHGTDTGSVEVQVAMLSERINQLSGHLQKNIHDFSSRHPTVRIIDRVKPILNLKDGGDSMTWKERKERMKAEKTRDLERKEMRG